MKRHLKLRLITKPQCNLSNCNYYENRSSDETSEANDLLYNANYKYKQDFITKKKDFIYNLRENDFEIYVLVNKVASVQNSKFYFSTKFKFDIDYIVSRLMIFYFTHNQ